MKPKWTELAAYHERFQPVHPPKLHTLDLWGGMLLSSAGWPPYPGGYLFCWVEQRLYPDNRLLKEQHRYRFIGPPYRELFVRLCDYDDYYVERQVYSPYEARELVNRMISAAPRGVEYFDQLGFRY